MAPKDSTNTDEKETRVVEDSVNHPSPLVNPQTVVQVEHLLPLLQLLVTYVIQPDMSMYVCQLESGSGIPAGTSPFLVAVVENCLRATRNMEFIIQSWAGLSERSIYGLWCLVISKKISEKKSHVSI